MRRPTQALTRYAHYVCHVERGRMPESKHPRAAKNAGSLRREF